MLSPFGHFTPFARSPLLLTPFSPFTFSHTDALSINCYSLSDVALSSVFYCLTHPFSVSLSTGSHEIPKFPSKNLRLNSTFWVFSKSCVFLSVRPSCLVSTPSCLVAWLPLEVNSSRSCRSLPHAAIMTSLAHARPLITHFLVLGCSHTPRHTLCTPRHRCSPHAHPHEHPPHPFHIHSTACNTRQPSQCQHSSVVFRIKPFSSVAPSS